MLVMRMTRHGTKKRPFYHIVVADSRSPRDGRFIEKIGTYNPMLPTDNAQRVTLVEERVKHWLKVGAQPSDRVARFLHAARSRSQGRVERNAQEIRSARQDAGTHEAGRRSRQGCRSQGRRSCRSRLKRRHRRSSDGRSSGRSGGQAIDRVADET